MLTKETLQSIRETSRYAGESWLRGVIQELVDELSKHFWQPIDTAPRDGTPVLGCSIEALPYVMMYRNDRWSGIPGELGNRPSHWQPLPSSKGIDR